MIDAKILAAVLASLTAVAVGADGGSIEASDLESQDIKSNMDLPSRIQEIDNPVKLLREMLNTKPEPDNEVKAELRVENIQNETFDLEGASLEVENLTSIGMGGKNITSDEEIILHGFSGTLQPGEKTRLEGSAERFTSSGVSIEGTTAVDKTVATEEVKIKGVKRTGISLSKVQGSISSGDTSTEFTKSSRPLHINSFSGDTEVDTSDSTVELDGKVDKLESGEFSFGG